MAGETVNFKLTKPTDGEYYDIGVFNQNMDSIDAALMNCMSIKPANGISANELKQPGMYFGRILDTPWIESATDITKKEYAKSFLWVVTESSSSSAKCWQTYFRLDGAKAQRTYAYNRDLSTCPWVNTGTTVWRGIAEPSYIISRLSVDASTGDDSPQLYGSKVKYKTIKKAVSELPQTFIETRGGGEGAYFGIGIEFSGDFTSEGPISIQINCSKFLLRGKTGSRLKSVSLSGNIGNLVISSFSCESMHIHGADGGYTSAGYIIQGVTFDPSDAETNITLLDISGGTGEIVSCTFKNQNNLMVYSGAIDLSSGVAGIRECTFINCKCCVYASRSAIAKVTPLPASLDVEYGGMIIKPDGTIFI